MRPVALRHPRLARFFLALLPLLLLSACNRSTRVTYDRERCVLDGRATTLREVEMEQARLGLHVLERQPIQTGVVVLMLLIAGAGYLDKVALLIAARRTAAPSFADRIRHALERHRNHPLRYFTIVAAGLVLVGAGGASYVYLDADKRASERALQQLQFCHLALSSAEEQAALERQRANLDQLQATTGSIKTLVDSLPPDEQRKAKALLGELKVSLANQQRMLGSQSEVARAVASGSEQIERDLGTLQLGIGGLKGVPERLHDTVELLGRVEARTRLAPLETNGPAPATVGEAFSGLGRKVDGWGDKILQADCTKARLPSGKTVGEALVELASRPAPVCRCEFPSRPPVDGGVR